MNKKILRAKVCTRCGFEKTELDFDLNRSNSDGLSDQCCQCRQTQDWGRKLMRNYGVTPEWYAQKLAAQNGVCDICHQTCSTGKRLSVDHDRLTEINRGLLCMHCNTAIGHLKHDPNLLQSAIGYLQRWHPK